MCDVDGKQRMLCVKVLSFVDFLPIQIFCHLKYDIGFIS